MAASTSCVLCQCLQSIAERPDDDRANVFLQGFAIGVGLGMKSVRDKLNPVLCDEHVAICQAGMAFVQMRSIVVGKDQSPAGVS